MSLLSRIFPMSKHPCVHSFREDSTLEVLTVSAVGKPMYYVRCGICGVSTDVFLTKGEAMAQAERGWMH